MNPLAIVELAAGLCALAFVAVVAMLDVRRIRQCSPAAAVDEEDT